MPSPKKKSKCKKYDIDTLDYYISDAISDISNNERMINPGDDQDYYLSIGRLVMNDILSGINSAQQMRLNIGINKEYKNILDFPSGHGRVLRFLKAKFPEAEITAGDIIHEAVDYCVDTFGATPLYSKENLRETSATQQFDLIWCGSLVTHFCEASVIDLLDFFVRHLERGGLAIFTTHGRSALSYLKRGVVDYRAGTKEDIIKQYKRTGYYYKSKPDNPGNSGVAFYSPAKMFGIIEKVPDLKVISYSEGGWGNHQDVITCMKGDWCFA